MGTVLGARATETRRPVAMRGLVSMLSGRQLGFPSHDGEGHPFNRHTAVQGDIRGRYRSSGGSRSSNPIAQLRSVHVRPCGLWLGMLSLWIGVTRSRTGIWYRACNYLHKTLADLPRREGSRAFISSALVAGLQVRHVRADPTRGAPQPWVPAPPQRSWTSKRGQLPTDRLGGWRCRGTRRA